jgi:hypothetical protein
LLAARSGGTNVLRQLNEMLDNLRGFDGAVFILLG